MNADHDDNDEEEEENEDMIDQPNALNLNKPLDDIGSPDKPNMTLGDKENGTGKNKSLNLNGLNNNNNSMSANRESRNYLNPDVLRELNTSKSVDNSNTQRLD